MEQSVELASQPSSRLQPPVDVGQMVRRSRVELPRRVVQRAGDLSQRESEVPQQLLVVVERPHSQTCGGSDLTHLVAGCCSALTVHERDARASPHVRF
jgi:hypothetical protein